MKERQPIQAITQGDNEYLKPQSQKKKEVGRGYVETLHIETKKPVAFEKPKEVEFYDSINERDNRFKVTDYSIDMAAGSAYNRNDSGKKLFLDKLRGSNILSWQENNERIVFL